MTREHSKFGGSTAPRVLRCPASIGLVEKVPSHLRKISPYAERGTAMHSAMARLITGECELDYLVGEVINGYTITADDVENALRPTLAVVASWLDAPDAEFYLERRVTFSSIVGVFGTVDLIIRSGRAVRVVDFKFGSGVLVRAVYPDGDADVLNAQLMFYAAAARDTLPAFFAAADTIRLTIVQPQSIDVDAEMVSSTVVAPAELDEFVARYRAACTEARSLSPRLEKGPHCRFCPARPICPEHTKPLLDLAQLVPPTPPHTPAAKEAYLQALAAGLDLVDAVKDIGRALRDQVKAALENGDPVPGYTLSTGRAERHWRDETVAIGALIKLGFERGDVITEITRTPWQVERRAKARGLRVPAELIDLCRTGTSVVRSENARVPMPGRNELARTFAAALNAFQEGGKHDQTRS